jgi:hypothetical protein
VVPLSTIPSASRARATLPARQWRWQEVRETRRILIC